MPVAINSCRAPIALPFDWWLDGDDAVAAASRLTSWPARVGPTLSPTPSYEPRDDGALLNGRRGVRFPTESARMFYAGTVSGGPISSIWREYVLWSDYSVGTPDRAYLDYGSRNTAIAADHMVGGWTSNNGGIFTQQGTFAASTWRVGATPTTYPQVLSYWDDGTTLRVFRNLQLIAEASGPAFNQEYSYPFIGASYGTPPVTQWWVGTLYSLRFAFGGAYSIDQIASAQAERMSRYAIEATPWQPSDAGNLTLWVDTRGKLAPGATAWLGGQNLAQWSNQAISAHLQQGTSAARPRQGTLINGRNTVACAGTYYLIGPALSNFVTAGVYEYAVVGRVDSVSTTGTTIGNLSQIMCDAGNNFWCGLRNNAGTIELWAGHWDTGAGAARWTVASGIQLGVPFIVNVWYDGTNIRAQVDDNPVSTPTAAGNLTATASAIQVGRRNAGTEFDGDIAEINFFSSALAEGAHLSTRRRLGTIYARPV